MKIGQKREPGLLILNRWSNNTQLLTDGSAISKRFILFKLFSPTSKSINFAFMLLIYFNFPITFIGF